MIDARLPLALEGGGLVLPAGGRIAVFQPSVSVMLEALPQENVHIIEGFKLSFDTWESRGFQCQVTPQGPFDAAIICLPRAKSEGRAMIAQALEITKGPIVIDGQKTDGIDSILKDMRKRVAVAGPLSKAHGKLFWVNEHSADLFEDWRAGPALTTGGFWTAPGVFSADAVDDASALLVHALPEKLGKVVADFGAGWGYLSAHVLTRQDVDAVHLVEAGHMALECARRNVTDSRAVFHWADAMQWHSPGRVDTVVMNPPFHTMRAADPALGQAFVASAARVLSPHGNLWMVANRHLPYEATLSAYFSKVTEIGADNRFKLFHATRPLRKRR